MKTLLVRIVGFPATLIHGDTLVLDRWLWLKRHLPKISGGSKQLLDVGCGTGAFTIGAARRGYQALGLSWDERNQKVAQQRASACKVSLARFEVQDLRHLDQRPDLQNSFDIVVSCENIEHILNDRKLMVDMSRCLKSGGTLLLTTPNFEYIPITKDDNGPFSKIEDGRHVRRGYTPEDLKDLCASAGFKVLQIGYCSGFISQKTTALLRTASRVNPIVGWGLVLPLRVLPLLCEPWFSRIIGWPGFSITLIALKH
jgi:SAM-dependent methyltransferase